MTLKQLAERLGVTAGRLALELEAPCRSCKKMGGLFPPCTKCEVIVRIRIEDAAAGIHRKA